jgi:glycosyltransferase involved in cell wall biosynthesis
MISRRYAAAGAAIIGTREMRCPTLEALPAAPAAKAGWPWTLETSQLADAMPDGRPWPRVSIITPSYNQGQFIEETIRSVLLQGYPNLEYIIVDGGSTDDSIEIIHRYAPWISSWSSERDSGQSDAINKGLRAAAGDIVAWLNSDDLLTPGALHKAAVRFASESSPAVVCGNAEVRSTDLSTVLWTFDSPPTSAVDILAFPEGRHIGQPSVFMSRELLDFPAPLQGGLHYVMDFELWLRLSKKREFLPLPNTLSWIRHHDSAKTIRDNYRIFEELEPIIVAHQHMLSPQRTANLIRACRRGRARAYIMYALRLVGMRERLKALRTVLKAFRLDSGILFFQPFYVAMANIFLPHGLRSRMGNE